MLKGQRFPDDQAEIVFSDHFVEYLNRLTPTESVDVLSDVVALCQSPAGKHALGNKSATDALAGWNTIDVLGGEHRVVFGTRTVAGVGTVEVLCAGPRRADAVYDTANAIIATGVLTDDEVSQIWQALSLLDVIEEDVGLNGWDYAPEPGPEGMQQAAIGSGLLPPAVAALLSKDELEAAMQHGWGPNGPDQDAAVRAALKRARGKTAGGDLTHLLARADPRCDATMPRAHSRCVRKVGHPGAHRSA